MSGTCSDCGGKCSFHAVRCEKCHRPDRKPQRKNLKNI